MDAEPGGTGSSPEPRATSAVCATHGLRFDPSRTEGCSRCAPPPRRSSRRVWLGLGGVAVAAGAGAVVAPALARHFAPPPAPQGPQLTAITYGSSAAEIFTPEPKTPSPLLLLCDPAGAAQRIVARYQAAALQHGWNLASSRSIKNGTTDASDEAALRKLMEQMRKRAAIDESRIYLGGLSGGGCAAYYFAILHPDVYRGAIVECGHMGPWRRVGKRATPSQSFFLFTRDDDFNRPATYQLEAAMSAAGCRVKVAQRPGGHSGMDGELPAEALAWLAES